MSLRSPGFGRQGTAGATGAQGAKGDSGVTGATGLTGAAGAAGVAGPSGVAGTAGATGQQGATGAAGAAGATGATGPSAKIALPNVTLAGTIAIGVLAGPRSQTLACGGALVGDVLVMTPVGAMPAGYMLGDARCAVAGQVEITLYTPAVALLANYSIPIKVTAIR